MTAKIVLTSAVALVAALGCARQHDRSAASSEAATVPVTTPLPPNARNAPNAIGGGPPVADAEVEPTFTLDANAVIAEPSIVSAKPDAQADGPSGGTSGSSSDNASPGAAQQAQGRTSVPSVGGGP